MGELIKIGQLEVEGQATQTVDARELHAFLGSKRKFSDWIKERIDLYGFVEGRDYLVHKIVTQYNQIDRVDYRLFIDMAKEICMVERNEKGKQARQYFIECEKMARQQATVHFLIPKTLPEALRLAANLAEENERQKEVIKVLAPKADFHDRVSEAVNCHTVQEVAKVINTGEIRLFRWLKENGYLMQDRQPYQRHIEAGLFKLVEKSYKDKRGEAYNYNQVLVTGKGLIHIQRRYCESRKAA